jgi:putative transposase
MVAPRETAELAKRLIANTCQKQGIVAGTLTIHADRGDNELRRLIPQPRTESCQ